jgi:A/G-specific adenine glycosylase
MKSFPTVQDLAKATEDEVNAHWAGLGFYRRARMLHKGAQYVTNDLNAIMPNTVDELMKIDGIGRYTASAVASIAFDTCVPVVDGNVCRVLSRLKGVANHIKAPIFKDGVGWKLAEQIVTAGDGLYAGEVNQAMMELGATYCAPSATGIDDNDPLKGFYLSTTLGTEVQKLMQTQLGSNQTLINEYVNNAFTVRGDVDKCALCNPDGISSVLLQISEEIGTNVKEYPAVIGHANFPTPPPKKTKREEVIVIAAMSIDYGEIDDSPHWLMVKRPKDGLLAGQWEFPSQCIWSSAEKISGSNKKLKKKGKIDVPSFDHKVRRNAIIELLHQYDFDNDVGDSINVSQLWSSNENSAIIVNEDSPIEHIFSHVRHSMWIEGINVPKQNVPLAFIIDQSFFLSDGREYKWMNDNTMNSVGITSAIKKILGAINKKRKNNPSSQAKKTKRKKRS